MYKVEAYFRDCIIYHGQRLKRIWETVLYNVQELTPIWETVFYNVHGLKPIWETVLYKVQGLKPIWETVLYNVQGSKPIWETVLYNVQGLKPVWETALYNVQRLKRIWETVLSNVQELKRIWETVLHNVQGLKPIWEIILYNAQELKRIWEIYYIMSNGLRVRCPAAETVDGHYRAKRPSMCIRKRFRAPVYIRLWAIMERPSGVGVVWAGVLLSNYIFAERVLRLTHSARLISLVSIFGVASFVTPCRPVLRGRIRHLRRFCLCQEGTECTGQHVC